MHCSIRLAVRRKMRLPKRSDQHIAESQSMTILRSHMPQNWIIRETTERDYGVDLYVELVGPKNLLSGNLVALQLKAKNTFKFKNGHSVLSGIKRETLNSQIGRASCRERV